MSYTCILCESAATAETHPRADEHTVTCPVCGEYEIEGRARAAFEKFSWGEDDRRYLLSAMTRTAPVRRVGRVRVTMDLLGRAKRGELGDKSFKEKTAAILEWIEYQSRTGHGSPYAASVDIEPATDYPIGWCREIRNGRGWGEWSFVFEALTRNGLIKSAGVKQFQITDKGWEYLESRPKATGAQGFIAMAFKDMDDVHAAIAAAVVAAGYKPLRIDAHEYVGGVMDEIQARIRESRFVVADLTQNRGGVYHEAGFALGLGIPVIPTVRRDHIEGPDEIRVHFDMQHLNLIPWTADKLADLTTRLKNRIESLFGQGPFWGSPHAR